MNPTIDDLQNHLMKRPIAPIFVKSTEKTNLTVLKLMCILDFYTTEKNLYHRMFLISPKLMFLLFQFHTFETFKYYEYRVNRKIGKNVLKCKFCDLIGPYAYILTHMVINHNTHIGLKKCAYCDREELKRHFTDNSLEQCYYAYIQKHNIEWDDNICNIVIDFYEMLKSLSQRLNIYYTRNHSYAALGRPTVEKLSHSYGRDFPSQITVLHQRIPHFNISTQIDALNKEFIRIISSFYGGNNASRLIGIPNGAENNTIIEISDNEGDSASQPTQSGQSNDEIQTQFGTYHERRQWSMQNEDTRNEGEQMIPENLVKREVYNSTVSTNPSSSTASRIKRQRLSSESTSAMSSVSTVVHDNWSTKSDVQQFGLYVAQRLAQLPDQIRRRLENTIQEDIVKAEKEAMK